MKKITLLLAVLAVTLSSCKSKYPNLENGLYAEFVTNKGVFVAKFYQDETPLTVANFIALAKGTHTLVDSAYKGKPFYNGLTFHRIIKDFMIQGGDPMGDGTGNPGYTFPDEIVDSLTHKGKGILSMANSGPATNGSQFFITLKETPWLNGKHTVFGEIVIGQEIVDSIGALPTTKPGDKPVDPVIIESVNIINKGVTEPSFAAEMEKIEKVKKEKEERISVVAETTKKELDRMFGEAQEYPSGLKIYWNHKGKMTKPAEGSKVQMNYIGYFMDGRLFETSVLEVAQKYEAADERRIASNQYGPIPFDYSKEARLIPGFREGMMEMSYGDKATIFVPSHLAYGEQGAGNVIPPNTDLVFELEILPSQE